jgi:hypothetical protein
MSGCQRVRVEPEGRDEVILYLVLLPPLPGLMGRVRMENEIMQRYGRASRVGNDKEDGEEEKKRRLTIISGSFQLERNFESKFLFGDSFNIDMPDSTWVGNYRFEVYCVD